MTELSGTLAGVGLPAIVRFLSGLKKTGCLRIIQEDWQAEIFFQAGQVTGASFGTKRGLSALDALVRALPEATFAFESDVHLHGEANIELGQEALQAHLDEVTERHAGRASKLPSLDAVPKLAAQDHSDTDSTSSEEPLPLDRATLQTLLVVDGRRTVREIVSQRGSFDALRHLGSLIEVGLIELTDASPSSYVDPATAPTIVGPAPSFVQATPLPPVAEPAPLPPVAEPANSPSVAEPALVEPAKPEPVAAEAYRVEPALRRPVPQEVEAPVSVVRCPQLGFEDDRTNSFGRPTRLHRCFAAGTPLPLSLDQQRELCISDQFATCPRLMMASAAPPEPVRDEPAADDPRIVRLPFTARNKAAQRNPVEDRHAVGGAAEPARFRSPGRPARDASSSPPTPLRARMERLANAAAPTSGPVPTSKAPAREPPTEDPPIAERIVPGDIVERRVYGVPVPIIAGGAVVVLVVAVIAFLLGPQVGNLMLDDTLDPATLPNTSAVAAGTPVSQLIVGRATPAARATAAAGADASAGQSTAGSTSTSPTSAGAASAAATAVPQPTAAPQPTQAPAQPTNAARPPVQPGGTTIFDEAFADNSRNWPNNQQGTAWLTNGSYRIAPRQAGQFVAIGAPLLDSLQDVTVTASFRKVAGPAGGGYGIIVRDQAATPNNGTRQDGSYYVLEVGDKGEVGIWRRDGDRWGDLLPWQKSDVVRSGTATNELTVKASGARLSLSVNGTVVATRTDSTYPSGGVGLFVGGDGNQVAVDRFTVQTP